MNIETVNELIASLESAGEPSIREQKFLKLAKAFKQLAAENKRLTDVAQGGAFVMQKALMEYEFGAGMTMQAEDFIRDAREKHSATDRIFAETEARGVEKGIAHLEKKFSNIGVQIMNLQWLADSLREGAGK
ncbi:hypothetical protein FVB40_07305 [Raoultella ornithinolytica]|uniref:hypothetical protein n=1 Tax=Raoultella ornithinolytica TaxID=54291 RepID=UPI000B5A99AC|nr:hypothetical protein [Raoultella ornithinolytica]MTF08867.1 hypothetical protein [Raoultella ornithinolytica]OWY88852.1 hypothetical protein CAC00_05875 [Raoultella ornithinolytica]